MCVPVDVNYNNMYFKSHALRFFFFLLFIEQCYCLKRKRVVGTFCVCMCCCLCVHFDKFHFHFALKRSVNWQTCLAFIQKRTLIEMNVYHVMMRLARMLWKHTKRKQMRMNGRDMCANVGRLICFITQCSGNGLR